MDKIEIGDVVSFCVPGHTLVKRGQVIRIEDDEADIWVVSEKAVYRQKLSNLQKI